MPVSSAKAARNGDRATPRTVFLFLDAPKRPYEAKPQTAKQKFSHDHPVGRERRALAGVPVTNSVGS